MSRSSRSSHGSDGSFKEKKVELLPSTDDLHKLLKSFVTFFYDVFNSRTRNTITKVTGQAKFQG